MLEIVIPDTELFDESTMEFRQVKSTVLRLEHSLVSVSKWEAKWKIPFLTKDRKTVEQTIDYIRCMTINQKSVNPETYRALTNEHINMVNEYISTDQTATTFNDANNPVSREIITSEVIYFWMSQYNIPMECQKWHLSRLLTLLRIAGIKNSPEKKMPRNAIYSRNRALNAARRKAHRTKG